MSITTSSIIGWIASLGWDTRQELGFPLVEGPFLTDNPDQIVHITGTGGPGYVTDEGSADAGTFQARLRGPSNSLDAAESAAQLLDEMILGASFPAQADGVSIQHVHRLGGRPTPLPVNPQDMRYEFTCNYVIVTG